MRANSAPQAAKRKADAQQRLDAIFLAEVGRLNPYPQLLAEALERENVRVRFKRAPRRAFSKPPRDARPRVLHVHWAHRYLSSRSAAQTLRKAATLYADLLRKRRRGVRIVWTVHDIYYPDTHHDGLERWAQSLILRLVHAPIVHSPGSAAYASKALHVPLERFSIIPHGHYMDSYPNTLSRSEARGRLEVPEGHRVLLFFGGMRRYKGLPDLFEAFRALRAQGVTLVVAGRARDEAFKQLVRRATADQADIRLYPHWIEGEDVQVYLNAADAFVLPVRASGNAASGSVMLAASFGLPIIAPQLPWIVDPIPEEARITYDPDRPAGLRRALERALDADLATMGRRNQEHVRQWDWDTVGRLTRQVYDGSRVSVDPAGRGPA